ncbi:MAG: TIGR03560 family F420-dependent LLM class oxidoreductase [Anaerolineales bacterium]|jgi:F420-dependent oxidoreductase-like protein
MIEVAIMIEGQDGLNWKKWKDIAHLVEQLGFYGLYRSDHFSNKKPPLKDSLELWTSLTWLASHTDRIEFGPLVTPTSFRHPVFTARIGKDVDDLSGGRLTLGLGAGWQELEHELFGFDLLPLKKRFDRFEESLEVISGLLQSEEPVSFSGEYYKLKEAQLLPRPKRPGGPPILIGGNGPNRTLPLAAQFADEWNGVFIPPDTYAELNQRLDTLLDQIGRPREAVKRSIMIGVVYGEDKHEVERWARFYDYDTQRANERGLPVGGADEIIARLGQFAEAGAERVMLQWLDIDNLALLERFASDALPQLHS